VSPSRPVPATPHLLGPADLVPSSDLGLVVEHLRAHEPPDDQQGTVRAEMLAFAAAHPDALHRSCAEGHFTGSALVLEPVRREVLVLFHTKLRKWLQPGGHTDGEANLAATARREAAEETGLEGLEVVAPVADLDIHEVRPPREAPHLHLDLRYLVVAPPGAVPVGNHESQALRWVPPSELAGMGADEGLQRLARRAVAMYDRL
jgi:8-oxo-dGTP pyrophosphatase MutT (NUDIX family)